MSIAYPPRAAARLLVPGVSAKYATPATACGAKLDRQRRYPWRRQHGAGRLVVQQQGAERQLVSTRHDDPAGRFGRRGSIALTVFWGMVTGLRGRPAPEDWP